MNGASTVLRGLCAQFSYGANIVALSEETGRNSENKPVPKAREAHFYSTMLFIPFLEKLKNFIFSVQKAFHPPC